MADQFRDQIDTPILADMTRNLGSDSVCHSHIEAKQCHRKRECSLLRLPRYEHQNALHLRSALANSLAAKWTWRWFSNILVFLAHGGLERFYQQLALTT